MEIKTPKGVLTAKLSEDENYPGIAIRLDGELVAVVEHTEDTGIRTQVYQSDFDEPVEIINYEEE